MLDTDTEMPYSVVNVRKRINTQLRLVKLALSDHKPHTLAELAYLTGAPEASVSARIRELRAEGANITKKFDKETHRWAYRATAKRSSE